MKQKVSTSVPGREMDIFKPQTFESAYLKLMFSVVVLLDLALDDINTMQNTYTTVRVTAVSVLAQTSRVTKIKLEPETPMLFTVFPAKFVRNQLVLSHVMENTIIGLSGNHHKYMTLSLSRRFCR